MEYDHPVVSLNKNGVVLHWQDPENFMIVLFDKGVSNVTPRLAKREGGDYTAISSGSAFSMSNGDRVKIIIQDDPGNSALQELQVDVNGTVRLTSTAIDDDWSAGSVGFYVKSGSGGTLSYDNFKVGYDNNADDDIADAGDDIQIDDDFASSAMTLTYDDNGNLTDDGIFKFVYDAWNRLVAVKSRYTASTTQTTFATYAYDGANRRNSKVVANSGVEVYPNDGGNTTVNFYYDNQWRIVETRNGSNQATWQHLWGTQYIDELIWLDKNGDPTIGSDCDPDGTAGESSESPADHRYFAHQDRNWNVISLTDYGAGVNGLLVERYADWIHDEPTVLTAGPSGVDIGVAGLRSSCGNPFTHQGLVRDHDKHSLHNRRRERGQRFMQRDPIIVDGPNLYLVCRSNPVRYVDPSGLAVTQCKRWPSHDFSGCPCWWPYSDRGPDDAGQTICGEDGKPCCCIWDRDIQREFEARGFDQRIIDAVIGCTDDHEQSHVEDNLPDGCKGKPPGSNPPNKDECKAYRAEVTCYIDSLKGSECSEEHFCNQQIQQLIGLFETACQNSGCPYEECHGLAEQLRSQLGFGAPGAGGIRPAIIPRRWG